MRPTEPLQLKRHCYVLPFGNWMHPHAPIMRDKMIWYPERAMNLYDEYAYRPYVQSIVTESPWLITLYDRERVRVVYEDGSWQCPQYQTYAADVGHILTHLLGLPSHVAAMPLDGGRQFKKVVRDFKRLIAKAEKLYKTI